MKPRSFQDVLLGAFLGALCILIIGYLGLLDRFGPAFLGQNDGLVVFRATATAELQLAVETAGSPQFVTALRRIWGPVKLVPVKTGTRLYVQSLPAGTYRWAALTNDRIEYDLPDTNRFVIEAGKLNYVGDLVLAEGGDVRVEANTPMIVDALGTTYPNLTASLPLVEHITALK
jgi:hypothetical protein